MWEPVGGADYSVEKELIVEDKEESKEGPNRLTTFWPRLKNQTDCDRIIKSESIRTIVESVEADSGLYLQIELMCH